MLNGTIRDRRGRRRAGLGATRKGIDTALAVTFIGIMLFPVYWMVNASLQPSGIVATMGLFPTEIDFRGYAIAIEEQGANLITSVIVAVGAVVVGLCVATPAAYALSHFRSRIVTWALLVILICEMIPGIVIANALYSLYNDLGLLNTLGGLIVADAGHGIPFSILIMRAFMLNIPREMIEAAKVDGANQVRIFLSIILPVSRNAIVTSALFIFLFAWSDFLFALTLTTNSDVRPVTLGIYQYISSYVSDWNAVTATAVLASLPAAIMLVIAQRYIAAGVLGGSVK